MFSKRKKNHNQNDAVYSFSGFDPGFDPGQTSFSIEEMPRVESKELEGGYKFFFFLLSPLLEHITISEPQLQSPKYPNLRDENSKQLVPCVRNYRKILRHTPKMLKTHSLMITNFDSAKKHYSYLLPQMIHRVFSSFFNQL